MAISSSIHKLRTACARFQLYEVEVIRDQNEQRVVQRRISEHWCLGMLASCETEFVEKISDNTERTRCACENQLSNSSSKVFTDAGVAALVIVFKRRSTRSTAV